MNGTCAYSCESLSNWYRRSALHVQSDECWGYFSYLSQYAWLRSVGREIEIAIIDKDARAKHFCKLLSFHRNDTVKFRENDYSFHITFILLVGKVSCLSSFPVYRFVHVHFRLFSQTNHSLALSIGSTQRTVGEQWTYTMVGSNYMSWLEGSCSFCNSWRGLNDNIIVQTKLICSLIDDLLCMHKVTLQIILMQIEV